MTKNECKSCGAKNDLIFSSCAFCNSPLENVDFEKISDQDLIMNANEWLGFLEGMQNKNQPIYLSKDGESSGVMKLIGISNMKSVPYAEICSNIEKYLGLLKTRASVNQNLSFQVGDLEKKYEARKKKLENIQKSAIYLLIGMFILLIGFGVWYTNTDSDNDIEHKRLQQVELQIDDALMEKDYEKAKILINKLTWQYDPKFSKEEIDLYKEKRENYLQLVKDK